MTPTAATFYSSGDGASFSQLLIYGVIIGAVTLLYRWWRKRRNTPRYQALAERYAGTYSPKAQARAERFAGTDWAPEQGTFDVNDYLSGNHQGNPFYCFGWEYAVGAIGDGDVDKRNVSRSVYTLELPGYVGHFSVRRHSAARRMFGQNDVQVGHAEFDERFTVRSEQPAAAQQVLSGTLPEFLLNDPRTKDYPLWFLGDRLVCSYTSRFNPDDAEPVLEYLAQVIGHLGYTAPRDEGQNALDDDVIPLRG